MNEALLHFIWRTLRFRTQGLHTVDGQTVEIIDTGKLNTSQGPDFTGAHLRIGGVEWRGEVELDLRTELWHTHGHAQDPLHNATILHVVYETNGKALTRADGSPLPELALAPAIDPALIALYRQLMQAEDAFPCAPLAEQVPAARWRAWLQTLGWERQGRRAEALALERKLSQEEGPEWEELGWIQVAAGLGTQVNRDAFAQLARQMPYRALRLHRDHPEQVEALLLGGANLLDDAPDDDHVRLLKQEWKHLARKFSLQPVAPGTFRMGRMRPLNFPTVRLAQLATVVSQVDVMQLVEQPQVALTLLPGLEPSPYWLTHYRPGVAAAAKPKPLTRSVVELMLVNTLLPVALRYARWQGKDEQAEHLAELLHQLPAEANHVTELYRPHGIRPGDALESQGLLELYHHYCTPRNCLACAVGQLLLKASGSEGN